MDSTAEDAELLVLLTKLLRAVSPEVVSPEGRERGNGSAGAGEAADGGAAVPVVSGSEARALLELVAARGIPQGQLAGLLGLEKSTVSRLATGLERKGWIKRGRDEANQRYIRLYLTPEGSEVATRVWRGWQSRQARIVAGLTPQERAGLIAGLRGLLRGLAAERLLAGPPPGSAAPGGGPDTP